MSLTLNGTPLDKLVVMECSECQPGAGYTQDSRRDQVCLEHQLYHALHTCCPAKAMAASQAKGWSTERSG